MKALIALENMHTKFKQNPMKTQGEAISYDFHVDSGDQMQDSGRKRIPIVRWTEGICIHISQNVGKWDYGGV